jgi:hypothetical protein
MGKHWLESKTVWFNAVIAGLVLACDNVAMLREVLPEHVYFYVSVVAAGANVWLRSKTSEPLK